MVVVKAVFRSIYRWLLVVRSTSGSSIEVEVCHKDMDGVD